MKSNNSEMIKIASANGYDYYEGYDKKEKKKFYNIVPTGEPAPNGGYYAAEFICHIKNVPNLF